MLLYQLVEEHYPAFVAELGTQGKELPEYVQLRGTGTFTWLGCFPALRAGARKKYPKKSDLSDDFC